MVSSFSFESPIFKEMKLISAIFIFLYFLQARSEDTAVVALPPSDKAAPPSAAASSSEAEESYGDDYLDLVDEKQEISKRKMATYNKSLRGKVNLLMAARWQQISSLTNISEKTEYLSDTFQAVDTFFKDKKLAEANEETVDGLHKAITSLDKLHEKLQGSHSSSTKSTGALFMINGNLNRLLDTLLDATDYTDEELDKFTKTNGKNGKKNLEKWVKSPPLYFYREPVVLYINKIYRNGKIRTTVDQLDNLSR